MTPNSLDAIVNTKKAPKKKGAGPASIETQIAENKKLFETKNIFYEDNAGTST